MTRLLALLVLMGCSSSDDGLSLKVQDTSPPPDGDEVLEIRACYKTFSWVNPTQDVLGNPLALADLAHATFYFGGDFEWQERVEMPTNSYETFIWVGDWTAHLTVTHINGAESGPSNTVEGTCND